MGSLTSLRPPVDSRWPTGWELSVDPATRALLEVLRRLNPGAYTEAQAEAEAQVEKLVEGVIPESTGQPVDYDELGRRLGLDASSSGGESTCEPDGEDPPGRGSVT